MRTQHALLPIAMLTLAAAFAPAASADPIPIPLNLPGESQSVATPAQIEVGPSPPIGPVWTPVVNPVSVDTPPVFVPQTCVPPGICAGPASIPGFHVITTPGVPAIQLLGQITLIPYTPVPVPFSAGASVTLLPTTSAAYADPDQTRPFSGPTITVQTPFGPVPISVCATSCPVADPTGGHFNAGASATVTIQGTPFTFGGPVVVPLP